MLASFGFDDMDIARRLQEEYDKEAAAQLAAESDAGLSRSSSDSSSLLESSSQLSTAFRSPLSLNISPVDPSLEVTDPNPDIRELFLQFNEQFFWSRLSGIEVKWSPRMTLCAGLCVYEGHGGLCSVRLSLPLLKLRPRKDLVETLLHEMIHAFLFVTNNDRDHDDHGPNFKKHMGRINKETGASISIYHTFHDEVASYQQHWWKCDGPCQKRPPYYGMVKRAMNRAPSNKDPWFNQHQSTCGGTFIKVKEPEGYGQKKGKAKAEKFDKTEGSSSNIRAFVGKGTALGSVPGKPFSNGSSKRLGETDSKNDNKGKGLAIITNGILTHKKNLGEPEKKPDVSNKTPSLLFSSVASSSGSSAPKSSNSISNSKVSSGSGLNKSLGSNCHSTSSSPHSSNRNNVKNKNKFNDNITLLELFKRRQAREKTRPDGRGEIEKKDSDVTLSKSVKSEAKDHKVEGKAKNKTDFVVDLTESDTDDFNTTSSSSESSKRPLDSKTKGKLNDKTHWKNIFPTMSKKKDKGKFKGIGKNKFPRKFVSVCDGGDYDDVKLRRKRPTGDKKKHKYVFDDLDSNDGLWDEESSSTSAGEEKLVKSFKKTYDKIQSLQKTLSDDNSSKSETQNERNPAHRDLNVKVNDNNKPTFNEDDNFDTRPSTSGLKGHVLGRRNSGLSFLAQIRRKMQDERNADESASCSKSHSKSGTSRVQNNDSSNKRRSDVAFGDEDIIPSSKRPSTATSERFIADQQDQKERNEDFAHGMVPCPSCTELVREADINDHLDRCLE